MALSLVQNHFGGRSDAAYFYAILEVVSMRKLKKYKPTRFMAKTSHYDKDAADYAVMFIESLCHTKGTWAGKPFELIDWQEQIIRDLFGVLKPNGYRQFNTAYIEIPKKQGKSELAAAVALLLLCGDGEERAEVYGCAADRNQAKIVFDVAVDMVRFCPALSKRVKILESQKKITYLPTNSSYQVLSADVANKHGFNTHGVIFDELHTQPNRKLFDVMLQGSGDARMQPLYMGSATPKTTFAFTLGMTWKKLSFSAMFQGVGGAKALYVGKYMLLSDVEGNFNRSSEILNAWSPTNTGSDIPRLSKNDPNGNFTTASDWYLENASYLRLKNVTLSYDLSDVFRKWSHLNDRNSRLSVYFSGENLATITGYSGMDPECGGWDALKYPVSRVLSVGVKLTY